MNSDHLFAVLLAVVLAAAALYAAYDFGQLRGAEKEGVRFQRAAAAAGHGEFVLNPTTGETEFQWFAAESSR